ncbi:MAG TPA: TonB-dependent receptor [bacterium]
MRWLIRAACLWLAGMALLPTGELALAGTTGKIAGRIIDADTKDPLPSVNVVVVNTTLGGTTNLDGDFFILNVPPGVYSIRATMVGYKEVLVQKVLVQTDLTTKLDFRLEPTVLEAGEEIVVVAEKPLIEKDVTGSRVTTSAENLARMPVDQMQEILALSAGAVEEDGVLHIRGGRTQEVAYLIDGAVVMDPLTGAFDGDVPEMALEEISLQTGGFGAEYGSAQSGIVNMVLKEGGPQFNGGLRFKTSDFSGYRSDPWHEQLWNVEGSFGGPVPMVNNLRFFASGEYSPNEGDYSHDDEEPLTLQGKLTYGLSPKVKLALSGLYYHNDYHSFDMGSYNYNEWRRITIEDRNADFLPNENPLLVDANGDPWYDNGQMDSEWEDLNGNGLFDQWVDLDSAGQGVYKEASEWNNLDGDDVIDTEDLNNNGGLDAFDMMDHTPDFNARADQFGFTLTHTLNQRTFYEVRLNRYRTYLKWNIIENTNEDLDGDGRFDMGERVYTEDGSSYEEVDLNGDGVISLSEDINGNGEADFESDADHNGRPDENQDLGLDGIGPYLPGTTDPNPEYPGWDFGEGDSLTTTEDLDGDGRIELTNEDLNGNSIWDYIFYGTDHDLYEDDNRNGFVDASEVGPDSNWIPMTELPMFQVGVKDDDDFFVYGSGNTYHRDRWHEDEKFTYNAQFHLTSQINPNHQLKCGVEGSYYDILMYDVDAASGGNIYGEDYTVFPHAFAAYAQDKMEFEGLIVNAGLRFDYFNANYDNYPSDITDPVLDYTTGGVIRNPESVPAKYAWSPRLGVSHPITERDVLYFNYGRYFQVPRFDFLFENLTFQLTGAFPRMGNANLEPEQTTAYELGVKHQFANDLVLNVTGFYKDITGLTDTRQIFYSASNWYGIYDNTDYGNVRGFELTLIRPRVRYFTGQLSYTYSFARGKNSTPTADYVTIWEGNNVPTTETFLNWDQRHTLSADIDLRTMDKERFFGLAYTENLGFNFIFNYGSGMPWSPPTRDRDKWKYTNSERMPFTFSWDFILDKGYRWKRLYTKAFLEVRNIGLPEFFSIDEFPFFKIQSRRNIVDIADEEWYALNVDAQGNRTYDADGPLDDPTVYGLPLMVRVGAAIQF